MFEHIAKDDRIKGLPQLFRGRRAKILHGTGKEVIHPTAAERLIGKRLDAVDVHAVIPQGGAEVTAAAPDLQHARPAYPLAGTMLLQEKEGLGMGIVLDGEIYFAVVVFIRLRKHSLSFSVHPAGTPRLCARRRMTGGRQARPMSCGSPVPAAKNGLAEQRLPAALTPCC